MISSQTLQSINERCNIAEVISDIVPLQKRGANYLGLCPFHAEKSPSFSVKEAEGFYYCFGCGASGNAISFVMKAMGMSFPEAIEHLASRYGIEVVREGVSATPGRNIDRKKLIGVNAAALDYYKRSLQTAPAAVKEYIAKRNITSTAIEEFEICFAPNSWDELILKLRSAGISDEDLVLSGLVRRSERGKLYSLFRGRLIFPIFDERRCVLGFGGRSIPGLIPEKSGSQSPKYVNSPETDLYQKSKVLYGLPNAMPSIRSDDHIYMVEGYMDVVSLWQSGVKNAVATCGTALTDRHVSKISKLAQTVTLLFDGDRAGRKAAAKSFSLFLNSGLDAQAIFLSDDEDPDTIAATHGAKTGSYLRQQAGVSLLKAFISVLIEESGAADIGKIGAAAKGKICAQVVERLRGVSNRFERAELIKEAAFLLIVDDKEIESAIDSSGDVQINDQAAQNPGCLQEQNSEDLYSIQRVNELPRGDRTILQAVMVHKMDLIERILNDPDICLLLQPSSRNFIEGLAETLNIEVKQGDASIKEKISTLLRSFGDDWVTLWKDAYRLARDEGFNFNAAFEECCISLKKAGLESSIRRIDQLIIQSEDEQEKVELMKEKLRFERRLRAR